MDRHVKPSGIYAQVPAFAPLQSTFKRPNMKLDVIEKTKGKIKEDATKNILNHFNRIHDKLFTFNNILIAGYFALSRIETEINNKVIMVPLFNLIFLIFIEYLMMEKSRKEAGVDELNSDEFVEFAQKKDIQTTQYSLLAIATTLAVFLYFLILLVF